MSALKYKNDQGKWVGVPSLKGERGVSVSDVNVTPGGHLETTMSDGSKIDAGAIPQIITSVNGKTGAVELTASDVGATTVDETAVISEAIRTEMAIAKNTPMFGDSGVDVEIGITTKQNVYVCIFCSASLADGQTITATPYWGGSLNSACAASGMVFNKWYAIGHPMAGMNAPLPKIQIKTNSGSVTNLGTICVRYTPTESSNGNDLGILAGALACNNAAIDSFASLSSQATALTFGGSVHTKNEAYACITTGSSIKVKITPTYSGAAYSGGSITDAEPGIWYKLAFPPGMTGTEFTLGLQLALTSGNSTSGIVTLRYISTTTSTS